MCAILIILRRCAVPHLSRKVHILVGDSGAARHALLELACLGNAVVQEGGLVGLRHGDARPQDDTLGEGVAAGHALQCGMATALVLQCLKRPTWRQCWCCNAARCQERSRELRPRGSVPQFGAMLPPLTEQCSRGQGGGQQSSSLVLSYHRQQYAGDLASACHRQMHQSHPPMLGHL